MPIYLDSVSSTNRFEIETGIDFEAEIPLPHIYQSQSQMYRTLAIEILRVILCIQVVLMMIAYVHLNSHTNLYIVGTLAINLCVECGFLIYHLSSHTKVQLGLVHLVWTTLSLNLTLIIMSLYLFAQSIYKYQVGEICILIDWYLRFITIGLFIYNSGHSYKNQI